MSVIVCSFNGEKVVGRAIESLLAQNYPKDRFEIIVVDDGSTDRTAEIVQGYPVIYLRHEHNQGIATARNTGLWHAKGEVYVSFDDDCVVGPAWLSQLARGYTSPNIAGVASVLVSPHQVRGLADHYMVAVGSGNPPTIDTNARNHWTKRVASYVRAHLRPRLDPPTVIYEVGLISGATASFPIAVLKSVGGWDPNMSGVEDTDLCHRISSSFPNLKYYAVKTAEMIHDPKLSVKQLLKRQLSRGSKNLTYYQKYQLFPPIFPFPVFWLLLGALTLASVPAQTLAVLLISPLVLYFWWLIRAVRERRPRYVLFTYLQLAEELCGLAGMAKGAIANTIERQIHPLPIVVIMTGLWATAVLLAPPSLWLNIFTSVFLLFIPGLLVYKIIVPERAPGHAWSTLGFAAGLSVLSLMLTGLATNAVLPLLGYHQPLSKHPLVLAVSLLILSLVAIRARIKPALRFQLTNPSFSVAEGLLALLGLTLPVLATLGATSINNGATNAYTLIMLGGVAVYALALLWPSDGRIKHGYGFGLFSIGLSLLLATSLRGFYITGHDIMQEYQVFQLTSQGSFWSMKLYPDAYTACLSITILPTIFAKLTTIADPYIYKTVFQGLFALVPVILFQTLTPYISKRRAFLSAFVFITFPTFLMDMPMLDRQEIAFLCFSLAFLAAMSKQLSARQRSALIGLMLVATIFSHYSTSYVALGAILAGKGLETAYRVWRRLRKQPAHRTTTWLPLPWTLVGVMLLTTYLWNTQITATSTSISSTISTAVSSLPQLLSHKAKSGGSAYSIVGGKTTDEQLFQIFTSTSTTLRDMDASAYYPKTVTDLYPVTMAPDTIDQPTSLGQWLIDHHLNLYAVFDSAKQDYAKLIQILMVLGTLLLVMSRKLFKLPRQYPLMGLAFLVIIVLQVILPSGVINYGLLRLIQQGLLFLAFPIVIATTTLPRLVRISENASLRLGTLLFIACYILLSGLASTLTGGYKPVLTTSNSGFYYDAYYTHADELAAFAWLKQNAPIGAIVNSDAFTRRKMITYAGIFPRPTLTPDTISTDAYVVLSTSNTITNKIPVYVNGTLLYQTIPTAFLQANKILVYSNDHVQIYR